MISISTALARINRAKIKELAGHDYLQANSIASKIEYFENSSLTQPLFGIYSSQKLWTVMTVNLLHSCINGSVSKLQIDRETQPLFTYFQHNDFCEYAHMEDGRAFWMVNENLCPQILNVLLMLEKVPSGTVLEP